MIIALDICELFALPLTSRLIVVPLSVIAGTVVENGAGIDGVGVAVGLGVEEGVDVDVWEGDDVGVEVGVTVIVNELLIPV